MIEILLYRHAKAEKAAPAGTQGAVDSERRLSETGRSQAAWMGAELSRRGLLPDVVLASDSARTRETVEIASDGWSKRPQLHYLKDLYTGEWRDYVAAVAGLNRSEGRVMVVGHNPAIEAFVAHVDGRSVEMKTGCLALIEVEVDNLSQFDPGSPMDLWEVLRPPEAPYSP